MGEGIRCHGPPSSDLERSSPCKGSSRITKNDGYLSMITVVKGTRILTAYSSSFSLRRLKVTSRPKNQLELQSLAKIKTSGSNYRSPRFRADLA